MEAVLAGVRFRKYDSDKGITKINYDYLGNPTRIQFADRSVTEYVYSADGRRLKTIHRTAVPQSTMLAIGEIHNLTASEIQSVDSTEYVGSYIYDNGSLARCNFDGGYVISPFVSTNYRFYIKDHLGNNRMVTDATGNVLQSNEYYPYGGLTGRSTNPEYQKFKYNGKEYDTMHGLNEYDYSARQYDPAIAQFTSMDPLCEKYYHISPYAYCGGNPVNRVDPDGKIWNIVCGALVGAGVEYACQVSANIIISGTVSLNCFTDVDRTDIALAALAGSISSGASAFGAKVGTRITSHTGSKIAGKFTGKVAEESVGFVSNMVESKGDVNRAVENYVVDKMKIGTNKQHVSVTSNKKATNAAKEEALKKGKTLSAVDLNTARKHNNETRKNLRAINSRIDNNNKAKNLTIDYIYGTKKAYEEKSN